MIELDRIHNLDCFQATTQLEDQSVDVMITDPPYPNRMNLFPDTLVDGLAMLYLGCKKAKKYVAFFWNPFDVPPAPAGWKEVARHIWHKPDCKSITHYEVIVVWSKEQKNRVSRVWSIPILDYRSLHDWKPHPTQKPVKLLRYLLEQYTEEGDVVFDPFVGSGTTAVACQQMKRHFIACDNNAEYVQIAQSRLKEPAPPVEEQPEKPDDETVAPDEMKEEPSPESALPKTSLRRRAPRKPAGASSAQK
ncbi:MAG TPA: site-specific DNA-methyltransferase [Blastocatellia bacterium]|nr:site-specific DNA-methyltransferase [Blastocatellia bacterium]